MDSPSSDIDVQLVKRSCVATYFLVVIVVLFVLGIVYLGVLLAERATHQKEIPPLNTPLDSQEKVQNIVDSSVEPFKPDVRKIIREKADFGDAPEETSVIGQADYELFGMFPTLLDDTLAGSVRHLENNARYFLGLRKYNDGVTLEEDGETVNLDEHDDGVIFPLLTPCSYQSVEVEVSVPSDLKPPYYLNALADWNRDSSWGGSSLCTIDGEAFEVPEWFITDLELNTLFHLAPGESRRLIMPDFLTGPHSGKVWFRFTLTTEPAPVTPQMPDWVGSGYFLRGETEDYLVPIFAEGASLEDATLPVPDVTEKTTQLKTNSQVLDNSLPTFNDIVSEKTFNDVSQNDWFYPYTAYVARMHIMNGFDDNTFRPSDTVTRAQAVIVALRAIGEFEGNTPKDFDSDGLLDSEEILLGSDPFSDDSDLDGLNDYREVMSFWSPIRDEALNPVPFPLDIIWLAHSARGDIVHAITLGILGQSEFSERNRFHPDEPATMEFALQMVLRAFGADISPQNFAQVAQDTGLIKNAETLDKNNQVNRAQMAKFVTILSDGSTQSPALSQ